MSLIALANLPKYFRQNFALEPDLASKQELSLALTDLISEFFSQHSLELDPGSVEESYQSLPRWEIDTVLAKLRSLVEIKAKSEIRSFCSVLDPLRRKQTEKMMRSAGLYKFRELLELDLYVGVHTAISAYFKMIGLTLYAIENSEQTPTLEQASRELFKTLRFIATLPLRYLMAVDGLFWDSKQYAIPKIISFEVTASGANYFIPESEIKNRLNGVKADEQQTGCPALRARTQVGDSVFDLVENLCMRVSQKYFCDY